MSPFPRTTRYSLLPFGEIPKGWKNDARNSEKNTRQGDRKEKYGRRAPFAPARELFACPLELLTSVQAFPAKRTLETVIQPDCARA